MRYADLVSLYLDLEATTKRLEKTHLLARFLKERFSKNGSREELSATLQLLQGRLFPPWDKRTLGMSSNLVVKAIAAAAGTTEEHVKEEWKQLGDLGKVAVALVAKKKQATLFSRELSVLDVVTTLRKLPGIEGERSVETKVKLVASLLTSATGEEPRFILRTVLEELRVGIAEGTMRDALCWAFLNPQITYDMENNDIVFTSEAGRAAYNELITAVQDAYDLTSDFGVVADVARTKGVAGLRAITLELGKPLRVMLAQRESTVAAAMDRVGRPAALEYKYDGFRMQIHKQGSQITIFTRRLENVTKQFPDVVASVKKHIKARECLIDCEAVGYDPASGRYKPFQYISQRIRRKYDIAKMAEELPVELNVFDILYVDGETLLKTPFKERRARLREVLPRDVPRKVRLSAYLETSDDKAGEAFYKDSLAAGHEGVMVKALSAPYRPGSRVGTWVKVKPVMDTFDLVIVAAEWGEGKRSGWLTSFTLACQDDDGAFVTIGRVGTGLKELEQEGGVTFRELTERLKPHITAEHGRDVALAPAVVLEVAFEEIQQSPSYESGYALRFPRVIRVRDDRSPEDVTSIEEVRLAFEQQRRG
ncbi:ATP-dependent DNA ligase [Candidatus Woesearchaeota archaeon]|nr:MAG: ATP-dependent DNA ligase [Candidatus Woesearchaeota archaeon]